ncbi:hypothetical protein ACVWXR_002789 [Pseudomonas lurida]
MCCRCFMAQLTAKGDKEVLDSSEEKMVGYSQRHLTVL